MIRLTMLSSLEKVFPDGDPPSETHTGSFLKNERFHFGFCLKNVESFTEYHHSVVLEGDAAPFVRLWRVELIPSVMAAGAEGADDYVLSAHSGLYPDLLVDYKGEDLILPARKNVAFFAELSDAVGLLSAGVHEIAVVVKNGKGETVARDVFEAEAIDARLPENNLIVTQWIHFDCIARKHGVKPFTDDFYKVCREYFRAAVAYGQTAVLTPLFTFALDTEIGGERDTFQLVGVKRRKTPDGYAYDFDFSAVKKFVGFAFACGFKYIEFSHLFTQWGALHAPKIMAEENGGIRRIFGWDTDSEGTEYLAFLDAFLPELSRFANENGLYGKCFCHLSDEPNEDALDRYCRLGEFVKSRLKGIPVMDALSHYEFYERGIVDLPAVSTESTGKFIENGADFLAYYCCGQYKNHLANRFFAMPSQRNRILGIQLYVSGAKGFLQWGFNFYNSVFSLYEIDPYRVSDAGGAFPSGDAYVVYPKGDGVALSFRLLVFYDGIQDYLALRRLEEKRGKAFVKELIEKEGIEGYEKYPTDAGWHLAFREKVNALLRM